MVFRRPDQRDVSITESGQGQTSVRKPNKRHPGSFVLMSGMFGDGPASKLRLRATRGGWGWAIVTTPVTTVSVTIPVATVPITACTVPIALGAPKPPKPPRVEIPPAWGGVNQGSIPCLFVESGRYSVVLGLTPQATLIWIGLLGREGRILDLGLPPGFISAGRSAGLLFGPLHCPFPPKQGSAQNLGREILKIFGKVALPDRKSNLEISLFRALVHFGRPP